MAVREDRLLEPEFWAAFVGVVEICAGGLLLLGLLTGRLACPAGRGSGVVPGVTSRRLPQPPSYVAESLHVRDARMGRDSRE